MHTWANRNSWAAGWALALAAIAAAHADDGMVTTAAARLTRLQAGLVGRHLLRGAATGTGVAGTQFVVDTQGSRHRRGPAPYCWRNSFFHSLSSSAAMAASGPPSSVLRPLS